MRRLVCARAIARRAAVLPAGVDIALRRVIVPSARSAAPCLISEQAGFRSTDPRLRTVDSAAGGLPATSNTVWILP